MPAASMTETLQLPALQVPEQQEAESSRAWSSSSTPTLRRRRFKMRRTKHAQEPGLEPASSSNKEFLQLPSIEITPSSDEDTPWSNCSTPSASPRRKRFLLRKWLSVREKKECGESRYVFFFLSSSLEKAFQNWDVCHSATWCGTVRYVSLLWLDWVTGDLSGALISNWRLVILDRCKGRG